MGPKLTEFQFLDFHVSDCDCGSILVVVTGLFPFVAGASSEDVDPVPVWPRPAAARAADETFDRGASMVW